MSLHLGYPSHSDSPGCRSLWGEQDRHRRCEHHRLASTPNDQQSKPSTVGTSYDASWTRQHWLNAGHAYSGVDRGPAWNARAFVAIILAFVAVALIIWFALGG